MVKEAELVESFKDLNLGFTLTPNSIRLVTNEFKRQIALAQSTKLEFLKTITLIEEGKLKDFVRVG